MEVSLPIRVGRVFPENYGCGKVGSHRDAHLFPPLHKVLTDELQHSVDSRFFRPFRVREGGLWHSFCQFAKDKPLRFLYNVSESCNFLERIAFGTNWAHFFAYVKDKCDIGNAISAIYSWPASIEGMFPCSENRALYKMRVQDINAIALESLFDLISSMGYLASFIGEAFQAAKIDFLKLLEKMPYWSYMTPFLHFSKRVIKRIGLPLDFVKATYTVAEIAYAIYEFVDSYHDFREFDRFKIKEAMAKYGEQAETLSAVEITGKKGEAALEVALKVDKVGESERREIQYYDIDRKTLAEHFSQQADHRMLEFISKVYDASLVVLGLLGVSLLPLIALDVIFTIIDEVHLTWWVQYEEVPETEQKNLLMLTNAQKIQTI